MLALVEAQNAATLARFNDARLAGHRDVVAAFYDRDSGDIDAHVGLVTDGVYAAAGGKQVSDGIDLTVKAAVQR
jgi:hypothetical protein